MTSPMAMPTLNKPTLPVSRVAIIGGGFGALMTVATLRFRGVGLDEMRVYSDTGNPEGVWNATTRAFRLTHMRSESAGHFYPTDSPGLATVEAVKTWSLKPLILTWFDAYHPTVSFFLEHTRNIARLVGYYRLIKPTRIGRITKTDDQFTLYNEQDEVVGYAKHIIIAVGHGGLSVPKPLATYRAKYGKDSLVVHSFEEKEYAPPRRVLLVGDGLTSGTECANALQVGSTVYMLSRTGKKYLTQALNTPRYYFSRRGIMPYRLQSREDRISELNEATRGTIKPYFMWMRLFKQSEKSGKLQYVRGELISLEKTGTMVTAMIRLPDGHTIKSMLVDQVVVATGFMPVNTHPLWQRLIKDFAIPLVDKYIAVRDDFCIDQMTTPGSMAMVIGPAALWALPSSDSLGGMKIIAHANADNILGPESWHVRQVVQKLVKWVRLISGNSI